jgi:hypothetical protein
MKLGLSDTSASSKAGDSGSGSLANASRCRGAGMGVTKPAGSSVSRGEPLCGARNATERKKGWGLGASRRTASTARCEYSSVE